MSAWQDIPDNKYLDAMDAAHLANCSARSLIEAIKRGDVPGKQGSAGAYLIRAGDARTYRQRREHERIDVQTPPMEPPTKKPTLDDVVRTAQQELAIVSSQLEVLEVRRQELTEVVAAAEKVQRFLRQDV